MEIPPSPAGRVSDYAGVLAESDRADLEARLERFERETTNQVAIAIFRSLEGESLEEFTHRLASTWAIGQAGKDNGVVIAVFLDDRKVRIEVGYGLEGALPDVICGRIIREEIAPRFRKGDVAGGLRAAVEKIEAATRGEYTHSGGSSSSGPSIVTLVVLTFFISFILFFLLSGLGGGSVIRWLSDGGSWSSGGGDFSGGGLFGGGDFLGGGGLFGGGGASGSW